MEVFYGCLGIAAIILALGAVKAIPEVLALIERVALQDPKARHRDPPEGPPSAPWGRRPTG
jgi:hypothetical protein